jgi:hypothetical protein
VERPGRHAVFAALTLALLTCGAGTALAGVSDGNYRPADQRCSGHADDSDAPDRVEEGCQSATLYVGDQDGGEAARVGFQQTPDGESVDPTAPQVSTGSADPASGGRVYFGADDNLDSGEHDSSSRIGDGPSDGGAIQLNVDPASVDSWAAALAAGDLGYLLAHPIPVVDAGAGGCADGACVAVQTERRLAYGGGRGQRDVADYEGHEWDPETCSGPDDGREECGPGGIRRWHRRSPDTYVEPGVQVYEDPNPAGSPIGPYPVPAAYAGTCGVIVGGGTAPAAPESPITNGAGQVSVTSADAGAPCHG